jgi:hypothetical protein
MLQFIEAFLFCTIICITFAKVKKYISILFLSIYLFTAFQVNELLKIPTLVVHFIDHQQENSNLTFFEFLSIHYAHGEVYDEDYNKDMKLPFKAHSDNCSCNFITFFTPIHHIVFENKTFSKEYKKPQFGYSFLFISNFHSSIWQPPKIC